MVISDEAKKEQFRGDVRQNFFFLKSQFFRSVGNVIQQIQKSLALCQINKSSVVNKSFLYSVHLAYLHSYQGWLQIVIHILTTDFYLYVAYYMTKFYFS